MTTTEAPSLAPPPSAAVEGERYRFADGQVATVVDVTATTCTLHFDGGIWLDGYGLWLCNVAERVE